MDERDASGAKEDVSVRIEHPLVRSYRELLRVERGASAEELRRSYRLMAKVYHPDTNPDTNAQAVFIRIKEAYQALTDPKRVEDLNRSYRQKRYTRRIVKGVNLRMGAFFGHREAGARRRRADPADLEWWGENRPTVEMDMRGNLFYADDGGAGSSILDHPKLDLVEVIFAGAMDIGDELLLASAFKQRDFSALPWFVLNNEGIVRFLEGDFEGALHCYQALNERIRNNIVFLYRLGLCHEVLAFKKAWNLPFMKPLPGLRHTGAAIRCFRQAIALGTNRPYLPQKCITIRKTLADLLEAGGRRWQAFRTWAHIRALEPESAEAEIKMEETKPVITGLLKE